MRTILQVLLTNIVKHFDVAFLEFHGNQSQGLLHKVKISG